MFSRWTFASAGSESEAMSLWDSFSLPSLVPLAVSAGAIFLLLTLHREVPSDSSLRLACAALAAALLPLGGAVFLGIRALIRTFAALSLTGSGGIGAVAAGLAESLLPLLAGFAGAIVVALAGLVLVAKRSRAERAAADPTLSADAAGPRSDAPKAGSKLTLAVLAGGAALALLVAMAAVRQLMGAASSTLAVVGGWAPRGSVGEVATALATSLKLGAGLSVATVLLSALLFLAALQLRRGALDRGSLPRTLGLALLLAAVGWSILSAVRVEQAVVYYQETALTGVAKMKVL
jgi:hypothetical protein